MCPFVTIALSRIHDYFVGYDTQADSGSHCCAHVMQRMFVAIETGWLCIDLYILYMYIHQRHRGSYTVSCERRLYDCR